MLNKLTGFVIATAMSIFLATQLYTFILQNSTIYVYYKLEIIPNVVKPGEPITVYYDFVRKRLCDSKIYVFILTDPGQLVSWRYEAIGGALPVGRSTPVNIFKIPELAEGNYTFYIYVYSICGDGPHAEMGPPATFTVAKPQ